MDRAKNSRGRKHFFLRYSPAIRTLHTGFDKLSHLEPELKRKGQNSRENEKIQRGRPCKLRGTAQQKLTASGEPR